ncbi:MAG: phosphotransferase [Chloroflexi bacterium]|nr:phosphotransferase [Chloroflexota bacterium]
MNGGQVARGPASRAKASPELLAAIRDCYGLAKGTETAVDIGGSSNLNLLFADGHDRYVARVYRPWVTEERLSAIQEVRWRLERGGVACALPVPTRDGQTWIVVDGRLVEVEPYVAHDSEMDSWDRLEAALPLLGSIHSILQAAVVSADGRVAPAANHIDSSDVPADVVRGTRCIQQWDASPAELQMAHEAEELAGLVNAAERSVPRLPRQLVHGDYWDNNVLFRDGQIVQVGDLDFMGERPRIDDLALTLYYTNSTFSEDQTSHARALQLRGLVDAYQSGLDEPLTPVERRAIPLALARTPLCFIAMIPSVDSARGARRLAEEIAPDIAWALALVRDLDRWTAVFA